jgi:transcriptional regulator with XRE-family HTH domain
VDFVHGGISRAEVGQVGSCKKNYISYFYILYYMQVKIQSPEAITRIMAALTSPFTLSHDLAAQLPQRVAALRQAKGLTQIAVAALLGISQGRYNHYERGIRRFPVGLLPKLVEVLECSEAELLGAEAPKIKRGPPSAWEKRIEAIQSLPRDKQREIQNVVDALVAKAL